jgi:DNA processing protein
MNERDVLILLNMVEAVGPKTVGRILDAYPKVEDVFGSAADFLTGRLEIASKAAENILKAPKEIDLQKELDFIQAQNIHILTLRDPDYPKLLKEIYDPPPVLYLKGKNIFARTCIAVVGSRTSTHYGNETAYRLSYQMAKADLAIVSGLARGIDTQAHRGAVSAQGSTAAVLGCGLEHCYPKENKVLAGQIMEKGCLLSEFPSYVPPLGVNFPKRNRLISGLSLGVLVVEASRNSGSLITADFALEQGRSVFAVPGRIDNPTSAGALGLIKDGARMVQGVEDIYEELGLESAVASVSTPLSGRYEEIAVSGMEAELLKWISHEPVSADQVSRCTSLEPSQVVSTLFTLELKKLIKQLPGKFYVRNSFLN